MSNLRTTSGAWGWKHLVFVLLVVLAVVLVIRSLWPEHSVTLHVLGEDSSNIQAMERLRSEYEKSARIRIKFDKVSFETAYQKAMHDLASNSGVYDIILQYNFSLSTFVRNDFVLRRDDLIKLVPDPNLYAFESDLFKNAWEEVGYYRTGSGIDVRDEAIGYPFAANTMLLCYNKKLFEDQIHKKNYKKRYGKDLAPPKTWDEFYNIAEYFSPPDGSTKGLCLQGKADGWLYYEWCNFAYSMGGGVMGDKKRGWEGDENTPVIIDSPETIAATRYYLSLKKFDGSKDYLSTDATVQRERIKKKDIAMCIMWSDYVFDLVYAGSKKEEDFGFAPIPGDKSMLAGGIYYINKRSKHPAEAARYVMHLMQKGNQVKLMLHGLCSALRTAYGDPEVQQKLPYARALRESLDSPRGVYMVEAGPDADAIQVAVTTHLQRLWRGEVDVEDALMEARRDIESKRAEIFSAIGKK